MGVLLGAPFRHAASPSFSRTAGAWSQSSPGFSKPEYQRLDAAARAATRSRKDLQPELLARFESNEARIREFEAKRAEREETKKREQQEERQANVNALSPQRKLIESGDDLGLLLRAWQQLPHPDTRRARIDLSKLRELVGEELTTAFATGFKACWRKQTVPLPTPGSNGVLLVYLMGLTGLTLEIRDGLDLGALSPDEAELAARFALLELNAFPFWFADLLAVQPDRVRKVLSEVLSSEWHARKEHHGVMRFASYSARDVGRVMGTIVLELAEHGEPGHAAVVRTAGDALLACAGDDPRVAIVARRMVESASAGDFDGRVAWLRVWSHADSHAATDWLHEVRRRSAEEFNLLVSGAAELLEQDFDGHSPLPPTRLRSPAALEEWVRILHLAVRPEDDLKHDGVYHPGTRDHAQDFRQRCQNGLAADPSLEAYAALRRLGSDKELLQYADLLANAAEAQVLRAVEAAAVSWSEDDVLRVEAGDEKRPGSVADLFLLVRRHLSRVGELVEKDDFSYRAMFTPDTPEKEIQRWTASSLRLVSRGQYSVVRENEVDDDKEVDISVLADGVGRIPVEIKPLGPYSLNALRACISDQLYGRYMQPSEVKYGVLLVVRQVDKKWDIDGKDGGFQDLVAALRAFANDFGNRHSKVIAVETIDLLLQSL